MSRWQADGAGHLATLGMIVPHMDLVPESEFRAMAPTGVSVHATRVPLGMVDADGRLIAKAGPEIVKAFAEPPAVDQAAGLLAAAGVDVIVYAFTSSSYALGSEGDAALQTRLEQRSGGIPVLISALAALQALRQLGARRIALVHPPWFTEEAGGLGVAYFAAQGFEVSFHAIAPLREGVGEIAPDRLHAWALEQIPATCEALFLAGNGFRAVGALAALEQDLGRPVVSANQALLWRALRQAGVTAPVEGYGSLFALP